MAAPVANAPVRLPQARRHPRAGAVVLRAVAGLALQAAPGEVDHQFGRVVHIDVAGAHTRRDRLAGADERHGGHVEVGTRFRVPDSNNLATMSMTCSRPSRTCWKNICELVACWYSTIHDARFSSMCRKNDRIVLRSRSFGLCSTLMSARTASMNRPISLVRHAPNNSSLEP